MIFNSLEFFIFFPVLYCLYCCVKYKSQNILLLIASYIFYGWWDPRFLFLIALSTAVDFCCGHLIEKGRLTREEFLKSASFLLVSVLAFLTIGSSGYEGSPFSVGDLSIIGLATGVIFFAIIFLCQFLSRYYSFFTKGKVYLIISIFVNLGILCLFKYFNFFIDGAQSAMSALGFSDVSLTTLNILLPVGISFYTFQTMSYSIDIYRGKLKPCSKLLDFALYVSYFPQLVAGPIERATNLLPRITSPRVLNWSQIERGICLIAFGLFKKVVIADGLAGSVSSVYGSTGAVSGFDVALATVFFAIQIYCDFSGYSDIARGVSKMLGIELMKNFNIPYFSRSPSEFWRRWHISLSSWLRDYLYISLGGNRGGNTAMYRNLMITMLLGGLWHGAAWNFILWGGFHGFILCAYRFIPSWASSLAQKNYFVSALSFWFSLGFFFVLTCYGWLLFRAESFTQIVDFTSAVFSSSLFSVSFTGSIPPLSAILGVPILIGYELTIFARERELVLAPVFQYAKPILIGVMMFVFIAALSAPPAQFIYFQF